MAPLYRHFTLFSNKRLVENRNKSVNICKLTKYSFIEIVFTFAMKKGVPVTMNMFWLFKHPVTSHRSAKGTHFLYGQNDNLIMVERKHV